MSETLSKADVQKLAEHLENCQLEVRDTPKITEAHPNMTMSDAYDVQYVIRERKTERGERVVGFKAGLTSRAKMKQMGVEVPCYGFLCDSFAVPDGGEVDATSLIHPKVEPEIAVVLKHPLRGPGCHIGTVMAAIDFVMPAIEIIDSRFRDFKFDVISVVADNCSSSKFVVGSRCRPADQLDLRTLGVVMELNGEPVAFGAGAAVLGHPAAAIAMMVNMMAERSDFMPAGTLILTGGITEAIAVKAGDNVTLRAQDIGSVSLRFI